MSVAVGPPFGADGVPILTLPLGRMPVTVWVNADPSGVVPNSQLVLEHARFDRVAVGAVGILLNRKLPRQADSSIVSRLVRNVPSVNSIDMSLLKSIEMVPD